MKKYTLTLFIILSGLIGIYGQGGSVRGVISDGMSEVPLPGATITIKDTYTGTITDLDGNYLLANAPVGKQIIQIRYLGYEEIDTTLVIEAGKTTYFDIDIFEDMLFLSEITVVSQRVGQNAAINQQIKSDNIVNVVSGERMSELPDANVGESIARLPGVSVTRSDGEANRVIIRGLNPAFNRVQIAGVDVPNVSDDRSTGLGSVNSESLGGVEVYKAVTPDMNPESTGGTVNLQLGKARNKKSFYVRLGSIYSDGDFNQYNVLSKYSQRFYENRLGLQLTLNADKRNRNRSIGGADYLTSSSPYEGQSFWNDYPPYNSYIDSTGQLRSNTIAYFDDGFVTDSRIIKERQGANLSIDYKAGRHSVVLSSFYNHSTTERKEITNAENITSRYSNPVANSITNLLQSEHDYGFVKINAGLSYAYTHSKNDNDYKTQFRQTFSRWDSTLVPASLFENNRLEYLPFGERYRAQQFEEGDLVDITNAVVDNSSSIYSIKLDFTIPFQWGSSFDGFIKVGGQHRTTKREKNEDTYKMIQRDAWMAGDTVIQGITPSDWAEEGYQPQISIGDNEYDMRTVLDPTRGMNYWKSMENSLADAGIDNSAPFDGKNNSYESTERMNAGYLMLKLNYKNYITFIPGFRYEHDNNTYTGYDRFTVQRYPSSDGYLTPVTVNKKWGYFLPMAHLQIKPWSWSNLRLAYTNTITRPNFQDRIPKRANTQGGDKLFDGNPNLETALSTNYDVMLSLYSQRLGLLSGGLFYKEIEGLRYSHQQYIYAGTSVDSLQNMGIGITHGTPTDYVQRTYEQPRNLEDITKVKGFEIEIQPNLNFLPGILNGFVITANYSRIWSESIFVRNKIVNTYDPITFEPIGYIETTKDKLTMPKQADNLFNVTLGYEFRNIFAVRWSLYHMGKYLETTSGKSAFLDRYKDPITKQDVSINVHFFNKKLTLFFNIQNLGAVADRSTVGEAAWLRYRRYEVTSPSYEINLRYNIF